ncbi:MAG: RIP metalloprotease RseP [Bacteroidetes bacterium]|nr:RIP metalloprotease RseP [Bacteroidota bacterium]
MLLVIEWGSVGIKTLQFILSFSILVTLHELGHFATAKWFGCRVEKFYLFFNPWFSLWKKKIGETEYGIGWVPFGGFVKISGMIDESMDKEQLKQAPQPYEFRSKPAWQRLIVMIAGVIVNILLAIFLFMMITYKWGDEYLPVKNLKYGLHADSLAIKLGIQDGDNIVGINGKPLDNFGTIPAQIMLTDAKNIQVQRNGETMNVAIPDGFINLLSKNKLMGFADVRFPVFVDSVASSAKFVKGELQKNDQIIGIGNHPLQFYNEYTQIIQQYKSKDASITVLRGNDTIQVIAKIDKDAKAGFFARSAMSIFGTVTKHYSFMEAIPAGFNRCFETLGRYMTGLKQIFTGKVNANDSLGSVISIGNTFPGVWDWERFWTLTAIFSIILAFMNILPIPALDGGHALFCLIEMITGKKPSDKFMEYAQMFGMVLLLGLMVYALGLDFWRLFK